MSFPIVQLSTDRICVVTGANTGMIKSGNFGIADRFGQLLNLVLYLLHTYYKILVLLAKA